MYSKNECSNNSTSSCYNNFTKLAILLKAAAVVNDVQLIKRLLPSVGMNSVVKIDRYFKELKSRPRSKFIRFRGQAFR